MRFMDSKLDLELRLDVQHPVTLVIEDRTAFSKLLSNLWRQHLGEPGNVVISENEQALRFDKFCEVIMNPFNLDFNHRKILGAIYEELEKEGEETHFEQLSKINHEVVLLLDTLEKEADYPVVFDLELDLKGLLKLYHVRIDEREEDTLSMVVSYIKLLRKVTALRLVIFTNLRTYFSAHQIQELYQACRYEEVTVLDIESFDFGKNLEIEKYIIVDRDLCLIEV